MNRRDADNNQTDFEDDPRHVPSPKPRRRRRTARILGMWGRIAVLACVVVLLLMATLAIGAKVIKPFVEASKMSRELSDTNRQIAEADAQNAAYYRRLAYLQTPQGKVTEARSLGYMWPGEVAVVVEGTPGQLNESPVAPPQPPAPTFWQRLRNICHSLSLSGHGSAGGTAP
jgi:hypothetical protein